MTGEELVLQEHELFSQVLQVLARYPTIPDQFLQGSLAEQEPPLPMVALHPDALKNLSEFWTSLGSKLRPSLTVTVTISIPVFADVTEPIVTTKFTGFDVGTGVVEETLIQIGGRVFHQVLNPAGQLVAVGIADAIVDILDAGLRAKTDSEGRYSFLRVPPGTHTIRAIAVGFEPKTQPLVVPGRSEDYNDIRVAVTEPSILNAVRAQGTLSAAAASGQKQINLSASDAAKFRSGDIVFLVGANSERAIIDRVVGTTITVKENLGNSYAANDSIRIADLETGQTAIRLNSTQGIDPGTNIRISQEQPLPAPAVTEDKIVQSVDRLNNFITLKQGLTNTYGMEGNNPDVNLQAQDLFTLIVTPPGKVAETFPDLSMDLRHSRYFTKVVDSPTVDVTLADPPSSTPAPNNRPAAIVASVLAGGQDDDITQIQATHYRKAIDELEKIDDVSILCIPDIADKDFRQDIQSEMILHCEKMQDRFAILDSQPNATPDPTTTPGGIGAQRNLVSSDRGFAALYYPWIFISNPVATGQIKVPPSGHIAGVYARTDTTRGVHKAPANEPMSGVLALERTLTDDEQGPLNETGINVLRSFPGSGIRVWGARTIAPHDITQWRYINVRRLLLFIEESIQEGTRFAVFEPNNLALWAKVKRQVTEFLTRVWRDGALFGATPDQAFRVRVDEELNPPSVRALGQLAIEVIVFPVTPAEFIVFRIIQKPGGGSFDEL